MALDSRNTLIAFQNMVARQGGGLIFLDNKVYNVDSSEFLSATKFIEEAKPFTISIYNQQTNTDEVSLTLLINPEDLTIGQSTVAENSFTRRGWVTGIWGRQQITISGSGSTAGFYVQGEGLSNFNRRNSLGFISFQTLIALFKNNGYYFHDASEDPTLFKDSSRVISVMDQIKIDYDGTSYVGAFSTFSFDDVAEMPYRMTYSLEFVASGLKGDRFEGHERFNNNELISNKINLGDQWPSRTDLTETIRMSEEELNDHFYNDLKSTYEKSLDEEDDMVRGTVKSSSYSTSETGKQISSGKKNINDFMAQINSTGIEPYSSEKASLYKIDKIRKFNDVYKTKDIIDSYNNNSGLKGTRAVTTGIMNSIMFKETQFGSLDNNMKAIKLPDDSPQGASSIMQIIPGTYKQIVSNDKDLQWMSDVSGLSKDQVKNAFDNGTLKSNPKLAYCASVVYNGRHVIPASNAAGLGNDPRAVGFGYDTGPGRLSGGTIYKEAAEYVVSIDKYGKYLNSDTDVSTSVGSLTAKSGK